MIVSGGGERERVRERERERARERERCGGSDFCCVVAYFGSKTSLLESL